MNKYIYETPGEKLHALVIVYFEASAFAKGCYIK